jgi:hypothetical protein
MNVDLNGFRGAVRTGVITGQQYVGRGGTAGTPKKSFAAKPTSLSESRARLDSLHAQIRVTSDAPRLCDLVDEYLLVAATLAGAPVVGGMLPGGSILAAAIAATGGAGTGASSSQYA